MYLPKLLFQITFEAIKGKEMFIAPIPANLLYGYGPTQFRKLKMVDLEAAVNTFPLDHSEWVEAQAVISTVFQKHIRTNWSEVIAKTVWDYIREDFDFDPTTRFSEAQIDENLMKLFHQMKSYQTTILYDVFIKGLKGFLRFLIGFANRNDAIKES